MKTIFRGLVDKYSWVSLGSSYLVSDINAAYLWAQIQMIDKIQTNRLSIWNKYKEGLKDLELKGYLQLPYIPKCCTNNAHMFYLKAKDLRQRTLIIDYLKENNINAVFHYVPLHTSSAGKIFGSFDGTDNFTTKESERLIRLPLYYGLEEEKVDYIIQKIKKFYDK